MRLLFFNSESAILLASSNQSGNLTCSDIHFDSSIADFTSESKVYVLLSNSLIFSNFSEYLFW